MADTPLILAFDTSGPWCGAILMRGEAVLSEFYEDMPKGQAERLFPILEDFLTKAGVVWTDLTAIGVGVGPGNFTGIRISVASARGMALGLKVPVVGVDLLEALALDAKGPVISAVSAPRDNVYLAGFGTKVEIAKQMMALVDVPADWAEPGLACVGDGAGALAARLGASVVPTAYAPASGIARIAMKRYQNVTEPPAPLYLKPPDAAPSRIEPPVILDHGT